MEDIDNVRQWFANHVTLHGQPYTLDSDQARAVCDSHQNTLVTARAGSGKTRVIVAKVAYLVAQCGLRLDEIAVFMFNRTAAAEVIQRIAEVMVDGVSLARFRGYPEVTTGGKRRDPVTTSVANAGRESASKANAITIASTFHKFALDIVKRHGENPQILSETEHEHLIRLAFQQALTESGTKLPPRDYQDTFKIVSGFIARAGQKYPGLAHLPTLQADIAHYIKQHQSDPKFQQNIFLHQVSCLTYQFYLAALSSPRIDFNLLMARATEILRTIPQAKNYVDPYKYLMIDEYQDFSYLFFQMISALRYLFPTVKIFAVGDDWQAINRFAGSDVDYFINFQQYFPEDYSNIPLATNYRSCRKIVEHANDYMLKNYDPQAVRAIPFNKKSGKLRQVNLQKVKYDLSDYYEDALGDGRFLQALAQALSSENPQELDAKALKALTPAAKMLKALYKIFAKHPHSEIMLLHRHNFTSCPGVTLNVLLAALRDLIVREQIMTFEFFTQNVRCMTMHKSKGLESEIVILLEMDATIIKSHHPHATIFEIFGDNLAAESADQDRLIYVALTRAKEKLYLLSNEKYRITAKTY